MEKQKEPPDDGVSSAACGGCTVHHLVFPAQRKEQPQRPSPLTDEEIVAIRAVFQICPVARRCAEGAKP